MSFCVSRMVSIIFQVLSVLFSVTLTYNHQHEPDESQHIVQGFFITTCSSHQILHLPQLCFPQLLQLRIPRRHRSLNSYEGKTDLLQPHRSGSSGRRPSWPFVCSSQKHSTQMISYSYFVSINMFHLPSQSWCSGRFQCWSHFPCC